MELLIGKGAGKLRFGMTKDDVQTLLGDPSFIYSAEDSFLSFSSEENVAEELVDWFEPGEYYQYDDLEMRLFFSDEENGRLVDISTMTSNVSLFGTSLMNMHLPDLLYFCKENGGSEIELDEGAHMTLFVYVDAWQITFTLEYDKVRQVSIGPLYLNDDSYLWPDE